MHTHIDGTALSGFNFSSSQLFLAVGFASQYF